MAHRALRMKNLHRHITIKFTNISDNQSILKASREIVLKDQERG